MCIDYDRSPYGLRLTRANPGAIQPRTYINMRREACCGPSWKPVNITVGVRQNEKQAREMAHVLTAAGQHAALPKTIDQSDYKYYLYKRTKVKDHLGHICLSF